MNGWSKATRVLFWCLAAVVALAIGLGVYDDLHKTQIIDVQRNENYNLSNALTKAQRQLIDNGVKPNTKTPDEISRAAAPQAGPAGAVGGDGARGQQGLPGVRGQVGPAGADGPPGRDGKDGADGKDSSVPGPAGDDGAAGAAGASGADSSVPGPQGAAGPVGPAGPEGGTGPAGADGTAGKDGAPGADGRSVASVTCISDGLMTYIVFEDQSDVEIGRVQSMCTPAA